MAENAKPKNIIVAGGSGLIGRPLTTALAADGHSVTVLTRGARDVTLPSGVKAVHWDGRTADGWGRLTGEADAIINLTGTNLNRWPWTKAYRAQIRSSRQDPGRAIVEALYANTPRPQVVFQIAGSGYYGDQGDREIDENTSLAGSGFLSSVSSDWEASTRPVVDLGVRHVILRTGVVLAGKSGVLAPFVLQNRLFVGGPLGSGKQYISWIHIADLVEIFRFLLAREDASGIYHSTAPGPVTNAAFGRAISRVMHRPFWLPVPAFALRAVLGGMSAVVLESQRVLPRRLLEMGFQFRYPELKEALESIF